jgi:hypothetical protein
MYVIVFNPYVKLTWLFTLSAYPQVVCNSSIKLTWSFTLSAHPQAVCVPSIQLIWSSQIVYPFSACMSLFSIHL